MKSQNKTPDFGSLRKSELYQTIISYTSDPNPESVGIQNASESAQALAAAIEKSLKKTENPFNILIEKFKRIFLQRFTLKNHGECLRQQGNPESKSLKVALESIEHFIKLIMCSMVLFYKGFLENKYLIFYRGSFAASIMNITIKGDIYKVLIELVMKEHIEEEGIIIKKIESMKDCSPRDLGINEYLSLDESSPLLKVAEKSLMEFSESCPILINRDSTQTIQMNKEEGKSPVRNRDSSIILPEEILREHFKTPPYQDPIKALKKFEQINSPLKVLKLLTEINNIICSCIDTFWHGSNIEKDKIRIDADQYLSIMIYIIIKANIPYLYSKITLINEIIKIIGPSKYNAYCLNTVNACFYYFLNTDNIPDQAGEKEKIKKIRKSPCLSFQDLKLSENKKINIPHLSYTTIE